MSDAYSVASNAVGVVRIVRQADGIKLHTDPAAVCTELNRLVALNSCVFCGEQLPDSPDRLALATLHVKTCSKHPMRVVERHLKLALDAMDHAVCRGRCAHARLQTALSMIRTDGGVQ